MEALIPAGKIAALNTGEMVGLIAAEPQEHYDGKFETSAIHCRINLDTEELEKEEQNYKELPIFYDFGDKKEEILMKNFLKINDDIDQLVQEFMQLNKQ